MTTTLIQYVHTYVCTYILYEGGSHGAEMKYVPQVCYECLGVHMSYIYVCEINVHRV